MSPHENLRALGLFQARAPRYTSYPPANHFQELGPQTVAGWIGDIAPGARLSLYAHIPYCRRLCWFCACRTQGTKTDRPLVPYLDALKREIASVGRMLRPDVTISQIHLGGGTPTLLNPDMIADLSATLRAFRPLDSDLEFSVEIDPTEVDQNRIDALARAGMTRASIGVQDFDPVVQDSIGREQSHAQTRDVVTMLRDAGVRSLNMDILYGLPFQTRARMIDTVNKVIDLRPDRVALYGYAHVPWMAKRQVMIPEDELPDAEARLDLFDTAQRLFTWAGYVQIGIDHFALPDDTMAQMAQAGNLRRNFQGYTADPSDVLIGFGASAISRYPQGYAQNQSASATYTGAVQTGGLASGRGHVFTADDQLRAALIEALMCHFQADLGTLAAAHQVSMDDMHSLVAPALANFPDHVAIEGTTLRLTRDAALLARLVCQRIDAYDMPQGRHSRAL